MDVFGTQIEFKPFEYNYTATSNGENKTIRIISPLTWVLGYKNQDISQLGELITDKNNSRNSDIRVCILHHLVMHAVFSQRNDIKKLFQIYILKLSHMVFLPQDCMMKHLKIFQDRKQEN